MVIFIMFKLFSNAIKQQRGSYSENQQKSLVPTINAHIQYKHCNDVFITQPAKLRS